MKSKEERNELKEEVKSLNEKLSALTEEELEQVIGGTQNSSSEMGHSGMMQPGMMRPGF